MRKKGHKLKSVHNAASMPEIPAMTVIQLSNHFQSLY